MAIENRYDAATGNRSDTSEGIRQSAAAENRSDISTGIGQSAKTGNRHYNTRIGHMRSVRIVVFVVFTAVILASSVSGCSKKEELTFSEYMDQLFVEEVDSNTLTLHYTLKNPEDYGITDYEVSLGDYSASARQERASEIESVLKDLQRYEVSEMDTDDALTYLVLTDYLDTQLALCEYELYEEPLLGSGGVAVELPLLLAEYQFYDAEDVEDYLELLAQLEDYLADILEFEQEKADAGLFMSDAQCRDVIDALSEFIASGEEHYLITAFESKLEELMVSGDEAVSDASEESDTSEISDVSESSGISANMDGSDNSEMSKNLDATENLEASEASEILENYTTSEGSEILENQGESEGTVESEEVSISQEEALAYQEQNKKIILEKIIPAYENLISELTVLMGSGHNDLGLYYTENGREYYELLVYESTGCSDSVADIFDRIEQARANDLAVCANLIAADTELYLRAFSYEWEYEDEYEMLAQLQEEMLSDFPPAPDVNVTVSAVDSALEDLLAPAFYITVPLDEYSNHTIYINGAYSYSDIYYFTTLAHEGFPGHLYQTVMSYEYGVAPIRELLNFPGYTEGWATYVEMMAYSYAGLDENLAALLMHNQAATLSLYASSDIGMHYYGWTMQDMYEFWGEYGVDDVSTVNAIAELILAEPGNYLKYYVGYLCFEELREEMQSVYGEEFSLVDFHAAVLNMGAASFDLLEEYFGYYYERSGS